jgi:hypothetical protein
LTLTSGEEIQKVFSSGAGILPASVERIFFPEKTSQIPDRPALTIVVLSPDNSLQDEKATQKLVETMTRDYGASSRTFKSALVFCVPDSADALRDEARKVGGGSFPSQGLLLIPILISDRNLLS